MEGIRACEVVQRVAADDGGHTIQGSPVKQVAAGVCPASMGFWQEEEGEGRQQSKGIGSSRHDSCRASQWIGCDSLRSRDAKQT